MLPDICSHSAGLSPLARGTRHAMTRQTAHGRFIPAGAGNTLEKAVQATAKPVYPRWRGEHVVAHAVINFVLGLSPLARGTPLIPGVFS